MAKTKALISFAVTAKLICVFVFACAKIRFSHNEAHIITGAKAQNHTVCFKIKQGHRIVEFFVYKWTNNTCTTKSFEVPLKRNLYRKVSDYRFYYRHIFEASFPMTFPCNLFLKMFCQVSHWSTLCQDTPAWWSIKINGL